ncbi:uncharacterized protein [Montipora capricornis]|uniref:uncharacterized protein n=1 Tax=Montipora capricornis TaxID=246305 RepID=UPI0035F15878
MAATDNEDSTTEKLSEKESSTFISVLTSMKASIDSGNSLLQELVSHKRSSPDDKIPTSKRRKFCSASQKANAMSSDEDETDASEEANTQHHHDTSAADALSLSGGGDIDDIEDTILEDGDSDNASLLSAISSSLSCSQDTGRPIASGLAELVNGKFNAEYSVEKRKEILQKYKKPSNCDNVLVPKVNEEIWSKLPANAKRSDIRTSALQDTPFKVSSAIICTSDKLLEHREKKTITSYKALINPLLDSVALLGHVCTELSYKRRDALKPFLHQDFRPACARSRKPGKLLFGNDLAKTLQELKTTNKLMTNNSSDARHYNRSSGHSKQENNKYQQKRPFLVNRGRTFNPPKSTATQSSASFKKKFTKT